MERAEKQSVKSVDKKTVRESPCLSVAFFSVPSPGRVFCGLFYFFVDKSVNICYNITMKTDNDFMMRFFEENRSGNFPQGKIKKEPKEIGKNQWPVKKIDVLQKKSTRSKKNRSFLEKIVIQQKKSICSEKKRYAAEKIDAFQKKSLRGKKNRCALKKIVMQPKKSICSEKNHRAANKIDVQQELASIKQKKYKNRQLNSKGGQKWRKQTKPLKITFTGKA